MKTRLYKKFLRRLHTDYYQLFRVGKDGSYELWVMRHGSQFHQDYTGDPEETYRQYKHTAFSSFIWEMKNSDKIPITNF